MAPRGISFDPSRDIPSLDGKVILITGGNAGLGKQAALELARHNPSQIWIAARNTSKASAAITEIQTQSRAVSVEFLELDLTSFDSIKKAAHIFTTWAPRLDILMLNAGVMGLPPGHTREGYETLFGTNHVGHALLFKLLTPLLLKSASDADVRVVVTSSHGHKFVPKGGVQFESLMTTGAGISVARRYGQSKLANVLFAQEIARRYPELTAVSVHPGTVKTKLNSSSGGSILLGVLQALVLPFIGQSAVEGARNLLWACAAKDVVSGEYYEPVGVARKRSSYVVDGDLARALWEWTEGQTRGHC
ncbi:hypothetical protein BDV28DRAFT_163504 [Aspergillus coremiiformis]|uniref:NAD(P)-binding protein n=1 Tax=Aspergillus coremiiformis TaxID=138285 RepID=A0A5N6YYS2_9EURO|nr:hypothetical protein BDV28DRAFT_163504 [Aspergillus coremiiformis]